MFKTSHETKVIYHTVNNFEQFCLTVNNHLFCSGYLFYYLCISVVWSYAEHEKEVGRVAQEMGFQQVSLSSEVMSMVRVVPRGYTGIFSNFIINFIISLYVPIWSNVNNTLVSSRGILQPFHKNLGFSPLENLFIYEFL